MVTDALFWHFGQQKTWSQQQTSSVELPDRGAHTWFFANALLFANKDLVSAVELKRAADMVPRAKYVSRLRKLANRGCLITRGCALIFHTRTVHSRLH